MEDEQLAVDEVPSLPPLLSHHHPASYRLGIRAAFSPAPAPLGKALLRWASSGPCGWDARGGWPSGP